MLADERGQKMLAVRDNIKRTKEVSGSFSKTKSHNDLFIFSSLLRNQINFKVLKKITKTKKKKKKTEESWSFLLYSRYFKESSKFLVLNFFRKNAL